MVRLGSLTPTRDLNYVANTVDGFLAAAACPAALGRTINLGSGREISIGALAEMIASLVGRRVEIQSDAQRVRPAASEVERLLADHKLATELLGWQPKVALEEGLTRTIDWIQEHSGEFRPSVYHV